MNRAAENRAKFPFVSSCVDALTPVFGPVRVIYAEENGNQAGRVPAN